MAKKAFRSKTDCRVAGVCGGLAEYFNLDSTLLRIVMILLAFYGGVGVILYLLAWFLIPPNPEEESTDSFNRTEKAREKVVSTVRNVSGRLEKTWKSRGRGEKGGQKTFIMGIVVLLVGVLFFLNGVGVFNIQFSWSRWWGIIWPAGLVGVGAYLIYEHLRREKPEPTAE